MSAAAHLRPIEHRTGPYPQPKDWPDERTSDLDLRSTIAFLTAQTAQQAGTISRMISEYDDLADMLLNERRDNAVLRTEHADMTAFLAAMTGRMVRV
jgi:hypothetical protein